MDVIHGPSSRQGARSTRVRRANTHWTRADYVGQDCTQERRVRQLATVCQAETSRSGSRPIVAFLESVSSASATGSRSRASPRRRIADRRQAPGAQASRIGDSGHSMLLLVGRSPRFIARWRRVVAAGGEVAQRLDVGQRVGTEGPLHERALVAGQRGRSGDLAVL